MVCTAEKCQKYFIIFKLFSILFLLFNLCDYVVPYSNTPACYMRKYTEDEMWIGKKKYLSARCNIQTTRKIKQLNRIWLLSNINPGKTLFLIYKSSQVKSSLSKALLMKCYAEAISIVKFSYQVFWLFMMNLNNKNEKKKMTRAIASVCLLLTVAWNRHFIIHTYIKFI